jgi:hypothetical protein
MRGRSALPLAGFIVVLLGLVIWAMIRSPTPPPAPPPPPAAKNSEIVQITEPVMYCVDRTLALPRGRVQVLVDSSGSMRGVRGPVINYVRWLEHGISRLRDSAIGIDEFQIASFDKGRGFVITPSPTHFAATYQPQSETTIHEAIRQSKDWDLTFIITDGVAAAGAGSGDCAAGVDAACVARALRDAVYVERTSSVAPQPAGIWIVPLWTRHAGVFFSERPVTVAEFDRDASLETIHEELEQDVSIAQPRSDRDGNLMFDYTGPRALMLIVIAHSADLGRSAVVALKERMAENNITGVASTRSNEAALGAFGAVELYPGFLPKVEWTSLTEDPEVVPKGTMDVDFIERSRIAVTCQTNTPNEASYILTSKWKRPGMRCAAIHQLPAFELAFLVAGEQKGDHVGSFIRNVQRTSSVEGDEFKFTLVCGQQEDRPCSSNPLRVQRVAQPRYDATGDAGADGTGQRQPIVATLSTNDLTKQPHRLYGFESLLSYFFDEVGKDQRQMVMADLEVCHGAGTK